MAAIATFDSSGCWLSTSVCEGAVCPVATSVGVRWGRWVSGPEPREADATRAKAVNDLRRQLGAHVVERVRCVQNGFNGERPRPQELVSADAVACVFLQGAALLSVRTPTGFAGLLCEAGDWVLLPAGAPHVFDAGASPDVAFLRLSAGTQGWFPLHTTVPLPPGLPSMDAFVEQLLRALGEDIEGSEA